MKKIAFLFTAVLFFALNISVANTNANSSTDGWNCIWDSYFKYPQKNKTYEAGKDIYVKVDPKKYKDIEWMELRVNEKLVRKESNYPYEWCKGGGSSDGYLRNMKPGTYKLECKIKDKCGKYHKIYCTFYVKGGQGGGGKCEYKVWYKYPQKNKTYSVGSDVYVYVDAQNHKYIEYAELYLNGKKIRKEANYPYEWCKGGGSSDGYLRNLKPGTYKLECKIKDKCGKYKTITNVFYVKGEGGGGNGKCEFDAWYVYPKKNASYQPGKDVYVYVDAKNYKDISKADLYLNGKFIRTESNYKYEWCKGGGSSDKYLRNLKKGTYKLKCVLYCKYGGKKEIYQTFYVR